MDKFFNLKDYKHLYGKSDKTLNGENEIIQFDDYYIEYLLTESSKLLNNKNEYQAFLSFNKALRLNFNKGKTAFDDGMLGVLHLNSLNFDLALMYLYKKLAKAENFEHPIALLIISILNYTKANYRVVNHFKTALFHYFGDCSLAQVAHLHQGIKTDICSLKADNGCNIEVLKQSLNKYIRTNNITNVKLILSILWELDPSNIYINYWYHNFDIEKYISFDKLPLDYIQFKFDNINKAINDEKEFNKLVSQEDVDSLINFVIKYCDDDTLASVVNIAIKCDNSKLLYHIENFLFSKSTRFNDDKKLIIINECIKMRYHIGKGFRFSYNGYIVYITDFKYNAIKKTNPNIAVGLLSAINQLVIDGILDIYIDNVFLGQLYVISKDLENKDTNEIKNTIIKMYYKNANLNMPKYLSRK